MATMLDESSTEFSVTHLEMIKGIEGHGFYGNCVVPIIENTARECELTDRLRQAIHDYPKANAVLVRRHGERWWGPPVVRSAQPTSGARQSAPSGLHTEDSCTTADSCARSTTPIF